MSAITSTEQVRLSSSVSISSLLNQPSSLARTPGPVVQEPQLGGQYYARWFDAYPYPFHENEQRRFDMMHCAWYIWGLGGQLHLATLPSGPIRILDVGYGTGLWASAMAASRPDAEVIAIDIGNGHPRPTEYTGDFCRHVDFRSGVDFNQGNWTESEGSCDFLHAANLCGSVHSWERFVRKMAQTLKPGGQAELIELDWTPRCETAQEQSPKPQEWWQLMQTASRNMGQPLAYPEDLESLLAQSGLAVTNHRTIEVRCSERLIGYTDPEHDDPLNTVARCYRTFMFDEAFDTVKAISTTLLTRELGMTKEVVAELCDDVNQALNALYSPFYHNL